jgi:phage tail-like protein
MEMQMPTAKKGRGPVDPYRNYTFRVKWDGQVVAGVRHVSALTRTCEVLDFREGGDSGTSVKIPGRTKYEAITLERGVAHDSAFDSWASQVAGTGTAAPGFRKEIRIEVYDAAGRLAIAYNVHRCWPSEYVALSSLEVGSNSGLIQSLTLQNEGWERDASVQAPTRGHRSAR